MNEKEGEYKELEDSVTREEQKELGNSKIDEGQKEIEEYENGNERKELEDHEDGKEENEFDDGEGANDLEGYDIGRKQQELRDYKIIDGHKQLEGNENGNGWKQSDDSTIDKEQKDVEDSEIVNEEEELEDLENGKEHEELEDSEIGTDSFVEDSDDDEPFISENESDLDVEAPLTDAEIEELINEFLEVESKAAEAQESLEKESLAQVENEVRFELSEKFRGDDLEKAVSDEMETYKGEWERLLDDLETQSALLLEQLDGAGVELPSLYKWVESQAPEGCSTEAWRKRIQWAGSQLTNEIAESISGAENYLQACRPVRRHHGKLLEEGASGFLSRKLATNDNKDSLNENAEKDWNSVNEILHSHNLPGESNSFGSKSYASVYLASTPLQAANMGLNFPGVDEVEEIDDIENCSRDPFYADAVANEDETGLTDEQKKKIRKVKEEEDAIFTLRLQNRLKQRRHRTHKTNQDTLLKETGSGVHNDFRVCVPSGECSAKDTDSAELHGEKMAVEGVPSVSAIPASILSKRSHDSGNHEIDTKRSRTVIIDSDDEMDVVEQTTSTNVLNPSINPSKVSEHYRCSACSDILNASKVCRHPLLGVIICENCKLVINRRSPRKDPDCSECYCGWCGKVDDLIGCRLCAMLFCARCIGRNFSKEKLERVRSCGWECCCCAPDQLEQLVLECDNALRVSDNVASSSGSDSDLPQSVVDIQLSYKKKLKKWTRRILDDTELGEETKQKIAIEKERQEHLKSLQEQFAFKTLGKSAATCNGNAADFAGEKVLGDAVKGFIMNVVREENEEPVRVPPSISAHLKPHQIGGLRFMWENCIQSVKKIKSGDKGLGCILAHTMGLGKTFQVIAFLYTTMRSIDLGLRTALIVTPVNVLHNWRQEFIKWRPTELKPLSVFMLEDVSRDYSQRARLLAKWRRKGGVLLIGYAAFRNLSFGKNVRDRNVAFEISHALQDGPDILVCDEAHMIKNTKADITQALKQVKCQRRIALTGSPLQNNLMEYFCMVDFVREGFLGSSHEFRNRFQNPIENGQHTNSTSHDVKIMNQRSHILYEQLKGFVQRKDMNVVKNELPPKTVYVISVKLSPMQRKLYKRFLDVNGLTNDKVNSDKGIKTRCFFTAYQSLAKIWNHPGLLQMAKEHKDSHRREYAVENFLVDDSSSDENVDREMNGDKPRNKADCSNKKAENGLLNEDIDWWVDLIQDKIYKEIEYSGKMVLLFDLLHMSSEVGDKALVFSQSLTTLDLIELFLAKVPRKGQQDKYWKQGKDWYRLDGSTDGAERARLVEKFNNPHNSRVKCALISTRAGCLGINLHAANRVIVVDGSWNPTHDLQAIYRVWRYGQQKPVYAYRLMAHGTMEEKIYKRQVTKEGLAARVVDKQQVHRTMSKEEILHLFDFGDEENGDPVIERMQGTSSTSNEGTVACMSKLTSFPSSDGSSSPDEFMDRLLSRHHPRWIANYHEHETLLQENEEDRLSKEEQDMALETFLRTFEWKEVQRVSLDEGGAPHHSHNNSKAILVDRESGGPHQQHQKQQGRGRVRKCANLSHLLTLRSRDIRSGSTTVCDKCAQEISWESLHSKDGKGK
ncbi:protein CHROMATIN REMODELING 20 [Amborella trichopoda]|uniref:ATP-dependent helicase ATRX n=1 Tax=Amborella trichopoda TaxID=13333 RepID=U5D694_AMBTC|nr:protein CHROMATIN REMODELING 20 [Amborella trichopoda]XP_020529209.1 protein CHROMATIN REMODELING 20 [Amborella trichopoda]ERN15878.1 hypothetical protein AMTR_s00039p00200130 [Amborella trichopoda]|eukprot:XP_006854411.1 protein CHROMATIN REMODELING 20 [Amborella trichopoda]